MAEAAHRGVGVPLHFKALPEGAGGPGVGQHAPAPLLPVVDDQLPLVELALLLVVSEPHLKDFTVVLRYILSRAQQIVAALVRETGLGAAGFLG